MKKILSSNQNSISTNIALLIARIGIASLMLAHGLPKMNMLFSGDPLQFPALLGLSPEFTLGLAVFAEVFCSIMLLVGFATRLATLPLIATMLVAVVSIHAADPFAAKELAVLYLLFYVVLFFAGSGKFSLDYLIKGSLMSSNQSDVKASEPSLSVTR